MTYSETSEIGYAAFSLAAKNLTRHSMMEHMESAPNDHNESTWTRLIQHHLASYEYETAQFLCELYHAASPGNASLELLGHCHLQRKDFFAAYSILKDRCCTHAHYHLLGLCCVALKKYQDGEVMLRQCLDTLGGNAHIYSILGLICR